MGLTGSPIEPHSGKNVWNSKGPLHLFNQRLDNNKNSALLTWEKELDEIFEEAPLHTDINEQRKYYDRYQEIIYEEKPIIYLYSPINIVAVKNRIKNLQPSPLLGIISNPDEIYIDDK